MNESEMSNMEEQLITYLDECLAAIETGESVESCLARYPDKADELAPLLQIALALEDLPQPGPSAVTARIAKTRFLTEARHRRASIEQSLWTRIRQRFSIPAWSAPVRILASAAMILVLVLLTSGGMVYAASDSLPGDPLYGFKLLGEDVQYALTTTHDSRIHLEETFTERRRDEVRQLLATGRQEQVMFGGLLRGRDGGRWQIEDIIVIVIPSTRVQAEPALGIFVEVHGVTQADGTVLADMIEIEGEEIIGFVETIGKDEWRVAGQRILVDEKTHIEEGLQVGDWVEVHARAFFDGTLLALEIERTDKGRPNDETLTPTPPSATPTPAPTSTFDPTSTLTPSDTPLSESTTPASPTPEPSNEGGGENKATPTVQPSLSPTAPPPTLSPTPTFRPSASQTPIPTTSPTPTSQPSPSPTALPPTLSPTPTFRPPASQTPTPTSPSPTPTSQPSPSPTSQPPAPSPTPTSDDEGEHEIQGTIANLPPAPSFNGTWIVTATEGDTLSFEVTASTEREFKDGDPQVGCRVEAETVLESDIEVATRVEVERCEPDDDDGE